MQKNSKKKKKEKVFQPRIHVLSSMYDPPNLYVTYITQFMEHRANPIQK